MTMCNRSLPPDQDPLNVRLDFMRFSNLLTLCGLTVLSFSVLSGCAGYQLGNQALYRPDVQTVHVPIFQSSSFRKDFGERLTEAVIKQIELTTPYKVVCESDADSILSGQIISESKTVLAEDINDVPRNIGTDLVARIRWESRAGDLLRENLVGLPPILQISQAANVIPEAGQSVATAHQRALSQLAEQIVDQMQYPW